MSSITDLRLLQALDKDHKLKLSEESFDGYEAARRYLWGILKAEQCSEVLDKEFEPSERYITVCCVCSAEKRDGDKWLTTTIHNALESEGTEDGAKLSHGYCPRCFKQAMADLTREFNCKKSR